MLFISLLIYSFSLLGKHAKSKDEIEFEQWIETASVQLTYDKDASELPELSLKVIPDGVSTKEKELIIKALGDDDSRARLQRLLDLVKEAGLYAYSRKAGSTARAGDLVFSISSDTKDYTLVVPYKEIRNNVKAALLLKLMDEYAKIKVSPQELARFNLEREIDSWRAENPEAEK